MGTTQVRLGAVVGALLLFGFHLRAADEKEIKGAIELAREYVKKSLNESMRGLPAGDAEYGEGPAALAGIALIEAGVPRRDPMIQELGQKIREAATNQNKTYQMALDIIFLDKLGEEIDTVLIQSMAVRLMFGQDSRTGGWGYQCWGLDEKKRDRLKELVKAAPSKSGEPPRVVGADPARRPLLASGIEEMLLGKRMRGANSEFSVDDNSNTQFAILALWAARRHGVPVEKNLEAAERRFRQSQHQVTGGWNYNVQKDKPTLTMTCVGLVGLAIGGGMRGERVLRTKAMTEDGKIEIKPRLEDLKPPPHLVNDVQVKKALTLLAAAITANGNRPVKMGPNGPMGNDLRQDLYLLWSLERVGMIYGLKTINGRDWYGWGADFLVKSQFPDGSWRGAYGGIIDASFGLMFLARSNIVRDLTRVLKDSRDFEALEVKPAPGAPAAVTDAQSTPLTKALVQAPAGKQAALIKEYAAGKGEKYSVAFADAIPQLRGVNQSRVREALDERLASLTVESIVTYLKCKNAELRRAAAVAVGLRDELSLIPDLIDRLGDANEAVWLAAVQSLQLLSGKEFGPQRGATPAQKSAAIADWKAWHQNAEKPE